ncbi:MAG: glycine betaine ABC transporter substrate-binding protein [Chloroflexota bacterium]|nr:glycine betaine ABC transporter substrate-binding protein [Chloroflexota bacterium]
MRQLILVLAVIVLTIALVVTGTSCNDEGEPSTPTPMANETVAGTETPEATEMPTLEVTVGNKNFTEEYIVGQLIKQLLEDRGYEVNLVSDLSTMVLREGMEADDIDICADYTGTAWMTHLGNEYVVGTDNNELYQLVKDAEVANGFIWLDPIWNNNTYALACWSDFAEENELETLSDLAELYNDEEGQIVTFVGFEFSTRPDGLPALEQHYGFEVDEGSVMTGAPGASLLGLENHECDVAMVFGTDAAIAKNGWHVFADDQSFFPPYDLTPYVREEVINQHPEIEDILNELVATFPGGGEAATSQIVTAGQQVWQELNAKVDIDKMEPDEVAHEYLVEKGLITE